MSLGRTAQNSTCGLVRAWESCTRHLKLLARAELKVWHPDPSWGSEWLRRSSGAAQRSTGSSEEAGLPGRGATRRPLSNPPPCRAVEIVDDGEVVRVGRQQQPQQPQHQSLAAAARRVGAVRTVDTYRSSRAAPLRWRGVCRAHEGAQAGSSARGGAYRRGLLAYWAAELSASRMQPMIGLSGRRCRRCRRCRQ